jgi:hypothetical protein
MNLEVAAPPQADTVAELQRRNERVALPFLSLRFFLSPALCLSIFYAVLTVLTVAIFQADTPDYEESVLKYSGGRDLVFWDFGHLLWRPLVWLLLHASHPFASEMHQQLVLFRIMLAINWLAGLGCMLLIARVVRRFANARLAILMAAVLALSQAFLNYVHTGAPYVTGLFFLLLSLDIATASLADGYSALKACLLGLALALAVLIWLPYIFAVPALLLLPILLSGPTRSATLFVIKATAFCAVTGLLAYASVAANLHLSSLTQIRDWIAQSSHSIDHINGFRRAVYGFNTAWFNMGNDGIQFRQFLTHDPYARVSAVALLFTGLWKLVITYLLLLAVTLKLLRGSLRDRRVLAFLALTFLPVFAFGVKWQGGDMERYLAAIPAILLAAACAFEVRPHLAMKLLGAVFVSALLAVNVAADLRWVHESKARSLSARLEALGAIPDHSYIVLLPSDPLKLFIREEAAAGRPRPYAMDFVLDIGYSYADKWRQIFASNSLDAWRKGGEVWICRGLLDAVPQKQWLWVEGAEPGVTWNDIHTFFSQLQLSEVRGDFAKVTLNQPNLEFLKTIRAPSTQ